jgi:ribosome-binding factor A
MTKSRGKAPSQRQLRVGEELRHALAHLLERGELRDPALAGRSITVTEVRVSPDLRHATAFVTPLGGAESAAVVAALRHAAPFIRGRLGQAVTLRYTPELSFEPDRSFEEAAAIERLLRDPKVRRDVEAALDDGDDHGT